MGTLRVDPRLRVLYLVGVAFAAFFLRNPRATAALAALQVVLWLGLGLGARTLLRKVTKLWGFAAFIIASYALTSEDRAIDRWVTLDLSILKVPINTAGAALGALMIVRVLVVVLASYVARAGDERAIAFGLERLGVPAVVATSIDAVLALLGGGGGGGGRGRGGGGGGGGGGRGRNRGPDDGPREGFLTSLRKIARGDVGAIVDRMERHIGRAETYLYEREEEEANPEKRRAAAARAHDVAVIVGLSLTMLGIKALKVLPNIPFAPGHKLVILTPLYIVASLKTKTRIGATLTGLVMGTVAFLLGDGRYGIFEIVKHVAPGILCDLIVPIVTANGRKPGAIAWSIVGGLMGLGRFATIFTVTLTVQPPKVAFAFLVPGLVIHTTFGVLSGLVSAPLIRAVTARGPNATGPIKEPPPVEAAKAPPALGETRTKAEST